MVFDNMVVVQAFVTVSDNLASHLSGKKLHTALSSASVNATFQLFTIITSDEFYNFLRS